MFLSGTYPFKRGCVSHRGVQENGVITTFANPFAIAAKTGMPTRTFCLGKTGLTPTEFHISWVDASEAAHGRSARL